MAKSKKKGSPAKKRAKRKSGVKDLSPRRSAKGGFNPQPDPPGRASILPGINETISQVIRPAGG